MLHAREDYNRIQDPDNLIPMDEPVFLLRGQDILAPELLLRWAAKLRLSGGEPSMAKMVEEHAQKMIDWQKNHRSKLPDLHPCDLNLYQHQGADGWTDEEKSSVYLQNNCIFQYCPHPELCEQEGKCMCPQNKQF